LAASDCSLKRCAEARSSAMCFERAAKIPPMRGSATRARVVLFRKPIERRAKDTIELAELLHEILVAQVATYLDVEPSVIDPTIDDE